MGCWYDGLFSGRHSEKPEGFCSRVFRNCSSWSWGNWYVLRDKAEVGKVCLSFPVLSLTFFLAFSYFLLLFFVQLFCGFDLLPSIHICWFYFLTNPFRFIVYFVITLVLTGVEHLLRDVKDTTISTLATEVFLLYYPVSLLCPSAYFWCLTVSAL